MRNKHREDNSMEEQEYCSEIDEIVRRRQWKRLITAAFVLDILSHENSYGNRIEGEIYERTGHVYRPNPNELYPVLRHMEAEGYVNSHWDSPDKRSKRIYSITGKGLSAAPYMKERVNSWICTVQKFVQALQKQFSGKEKEN